MAERAVDVQRPRAESSRLSCRVHVGGRWHPRRRAAEQLRAVARDYRARSHRRDYAPGASRQASGCSHRRRAMTALITPANQLTLLRMLLIPAFVILVVY